MGQRFSIHDFSGGIPGNFVIFSKSFIVKAKQTRDRFAETPTTESPAAGDTEAEGSSHGAARRVPMEYWSQWRERCASQLCDAPARDLLQGFVATRFNRFIQRIGFAVKNVRGAGLVPASQCMHLLESFIAVGQHKKGKAYKNWLFTRAPETQVGAVEGGVTVLIRDVVRDYVRKEFSPIFMCSMEDLTAGMRGRGLTIDDLISVGPAPDEAVAAREVKELAVEGAHAFVERVDHRTRVALVARELGLSLADPLVLDIAGCRKSALNDSHQKLCQHVCAVLKKRFPREHPGVVRQLVAATLCEVSRAIMDSACGKPPYARLFEAAGGL